MGTEIAVGATASLTLAPNDAQALLATSDERELTDEQFVIVERIAEAPPPALPAATDDDVRAVIGSLSTVKKRRNTSLQEGRLQLGLYRKVLTGIPAAALKHAGDVFLRKPGWMPEPAEVLEEANRYLAPETRLHTRARYLARMRLQRLWEAKCKSIKDGTFPSDQLHTLTEQEIRIGIMARTILTELDGSPIPWTREDEERIRQERMESMGLQENERSFRACACEVCQDVGEVMAEDGSVAPCQCQQGEGS